MGSGALLASAVFHAENEEGSPAWAGLPHAFAIWTTLFEASPDFSGNPSSPESF